ncbi:carbohydrate porin [Photobacterium sagamiensis]|uniref:carbohydrate porin n=1 Tax=Photobacterium sagamiensis TaxID=2910241 RepID=UPI003D104D50
MNKKILSCLVAGAVMSAPAMAISDPEFFGYAKWGKIFTNDDTTNDGTGELKDITRTKGGIGNFRLGNELKWWEAGLKGDVYESGDTNWDVTWMIGNGGGDWSNIMTMQMYTSATGVLESVPEAKVWAGKRYYRKHEAYLIDVKYWDTADTGLGIEDVDVGFGKFHAAWFMPDAKWGQPIEKEDGSLDYKAGAFHNLDFRVSDIRFAKGASLTLGVNYATLQNRDMSPSEFNISDDGLMLSAVYAQTWSKGVNRLAVQYGTDGLAGGLMNGIGTESQYRIGLEHEGSSIRVFNEGEMRLTPQIDMMYAIAYQDVDLDNGNGFEWASASVMPQYAWNKYHTTAFQVGYDFAKDQTGIGKNETFKATISQQIQAGEGVWARPAIRVFASYIDQTQDWAPGGNEWGAIPGKAAFAESFAKDEVVFGANFEAWW